MKKKIVCLSLGLCLTLSGCAGLNSSAEQKMLEKAGITDDSNYKTYQTYSVDGKLTAQGYYSEEIFEDESSAETVPAGTTLVSFAQNSCLYISYFADPGHTEPIEAQSCYLKPGDTVYATVELSRDVASSMYSFTGFQMYKYQRGGRDLIDTIELGQDGLVLEITEDMVGSDYSLEPIGAYETRIITLRDFYTDDNDKEHDYVGTWLVDDKVVTGDKAEINPVSSYIISYEYDKDEYFFVSSSPKCYYSNNDDGIVIFELMNATDDSYDYSVELCKYLSVDVSSSVKRTIIRGSGAEQVVEAGSKYTFTGLKYGRSIELSTDSEWPQLRNCKELIVTEHKQSNGTYKYKVVLPDKDGQFWFDPNEYTYEHGEIGFQWLGEEITEPIQLARGRVITYYAKSVDKGYWLGDGDHTIVIGSDEETRAALNGIHFQTEAKVTVNLPQPQRGGTITYYADGKKLTGTTFTTTSGKIITMNFDGWEGWVENCKDGETYQVNGNNNQTVKIQGDKSVDEAFYEDENHMPTLEVVLNKSVGENMKFSISAAGLDKTECSYSGSWYNNDVKVLPTEKNNIKIGTYEGISLDFGNRALEAGTAVKVLVEMEPKEGKTISYYRLIDDLSEKQKPIDIYSASEMGSSTVWYKSIKITVSIVEVETFTAPKNPANGTVVVRVADTQVALKNGDLIEPAEEVTVTISAADDYYVSGKSVKNDIYQSKMKFSKYLEEISDIISEHPIEKYIHLTLTSSDNYGTCTYKLDKEEVSGEIRVKADQKLTITYTVTANGYVIEGGSGGFLGFGKTDTEKSETITVTAGMNGQSIDRTNFGINVVKGE